MKKLLFSALFLLIAPVAAAQSTCSLPSQTTSGNELFEYIHGHLEVSPLTSKTVPGYTLNTKTGSSSYKAQFADPKKSENCYGLVAVQDYGTAANSLCRINAEIKSPTDHGYDLTLTTGSPYATAGYVYTEKSGAFRNVVSYLDRYQIGTLVYCGTSKLEQFHSEAMRLATEYLATPKFSDTSSAKFAEAIGYLARAKIVAGYPDGTYKPDNEINRAEFTKIVAGAAYGPSSLSGGSCFSDVGSEWFAPAICTAKGKQVVAGYPDGAFRPADPVSVAEAMKIVFAALAPSQVRTASAGEAWYQPFVDAAKVAGVYLTDFAKLDQKLTRGQMAEIIYRIQTDTLSAAGIDFLVTSPAVDGGSYTATTLPIRVTGRAPAGSSITVNGSYTLKSCCTTGGTEWEYKLASEYGNIGTGKNNYEFVAKDSSGAILGRSKITVIYGE